MRAELKAGRPPCPKCGFAEVVKCGLQRGRQRYRCPRCRYQYTSTELKGKCGRDKALALALYSWGLSMAAISGLLHVTIPAVHYWIRDFRDKNFQKPSPARMITIPLREIMKGLPEDNIAGRENVVLVSVDENTGEIAGMIKVPAKAPSPEQDSHYETLHCN